MPGIGESVGYKMLTNKITLYNRNIGIESVTIGYFVGKRLTSAFRSNINPLMMTTIRLKDDCTK